ncbi:MAG: extracellular solute-binding protein [Clostridiales bacterium]|nr:extracellular solute-binding protein [Clostridiales bacterium]
MRKPGNKKMTRLCLLSLAALLLVCSVASAQETAGYTFAYRAGSYAAYDEAHKEWEKPYEEIILKGIDGVADAAAQCTTQSIDGRDALVMSEQGDTVTWTFQVEKAGRYSLELTYYALEGTGNLLEYELLLDGEIPFTEAKQLQLTRLYQDAVTEFAQDTLGNDLRPRQEEVFTWQSKDLHDVNGYVNGSYLFALTEGEHTLTLKSVRDPAAIDSLRFYNAVQAPTYAEYIAAYADAPKGTGIVTVEAEHAAYKTSTQLYPISDRSDPQTSPSDPIAKRLNIIGGTNWATSDQSITWNFTVPEDGLYTLSFRYRQNYLRGMLVYRTVKVDGQMPFRELEQVEFPYGVAWQTCTLGGENPYQFYLTKGEHSLTLTPTTGDMAPLMSVVDSIVSELNNLYRRIIMITGTTPDIYRDYFLHESVPGMIDTMTALAVELRNVEAKIQDMTGYTGTEAASLLRLAEQLESFVERPGSIPGRLSSYRDNVVAISSWVLTISKQSMDIDVIYITPAEAELPRTASTLWENLGYQAQALIGSFTTDYEAIGNLAEGSKVIDVWISSGRDQAEVLKELIDSEFTPKTGIGVNLCIVQSGLMQAVMADAGPDVAIMLGRGDPVNYALRGAVLPLEDFEGFDELVQEYMPSAMTPFEWNGHYWGLPNTQNFYVMFYRTDVFQELGLEPPETWNDLLLVAETLQRNNMNIGLPYTSLDAYASVSTGIGGTTLFPTLLLQNGIGLYTEDRLTTTLNSPISLKAFKLWTSFYTQYGFPLYKDDFNRFRTGEMPLVITNYTFYSQLKTAAPDIRNLWAMALIPGTVKDDGTIDHSTAAFGSAGMILSTTDAAQESWEFLRWWNGAEAQTAYGRQIENVLGPAGRYNPANVEAMQSMMWSGEELKLIEEQWNWVKEMPELPGSYYVSRNVDNAFKEVYYEKGNARETLNYWTRQINEELERKRNEFAVQTQGGETK